MVLLVLSGPSGAGKSTLLKKLFAEFPDKFGFSVSHTTRGPRGGEADGKDYHFTTAQNFADLVASNSFLEHATYAGNSYGTSLKAVEDVEKAGRHCILDIEMEGVKQVKASGRAAKFIFVRPPSLEILEERLRGRGSDKEEAIQKRLNQAKNELDYAAGGVHDITIINDDIEKAYGELKKYILEVIGEQ
ncbi:guanylate kinase [Ascobolus immersus RN42]|uniref:Guanylate kinase n=1 Tax=Ascobolus immersus RN42 TaxID=1160509 RepID=A0A3N4I7L9_ASCIM|nr:guanylate kinase [Ascobolus immersus RN42]